MKEYKKRIADLILTDKLEWSEKRRQLHSSELMTIFAIDYTNAMMKRILIPIVALICLFCLSNCEKEGPVEPSIKMLYGDYMKLPPEDKRVTHGVSLAGCEDVDMEK